MSRKPPTPKRPGRAPASDEIVALAVELVRGQGWSLAATARELRVGEATVRGWLRRAAVTPRTDVTDEIRARVEERAAAVAALPEESAPVEGEGAPPADVAAFLQSMMGDAQRVAQAARAQGNHAAAQRAMRDAVAMATTLARVQKSRDELGDSIVVSRAQIDQVIEDYRAKVKIALERPLLCAQCHRELVAQWGAAALESEPAPPGSKPER